MTFLRAALAASLASLTALTVATAGGTFAAPGVPPSMADADPTISQPAADPFYAAASAMGIRVIVTDLIGLGTPGQHTYVNHTEEGHAALDAQPGQDWDSRMSRQIPLSPSTATPRVAAQRPAPRNTRRPTPLN